jgi:hypothetical protein
MTHANVEPAQPTENVGRGAAVALLAIPASIVIFAVVGGAVGVVIGFAALALPYITAWLYRKGAGVPLGRRGTPAFATISAVAIVIGTAVGVISGLYNSFTSVGGDGGPLGDAFLTTVRIQFTTNPEEQAVAVLLGLGLGIAGIIGVLRAARTADSGSGTSGPRRVGPRGVGPRRVGSGGIAQSTLPGALDGNQPSPGIILNGKPLDPDKK